MSFHQRRVYWESGRERKVARRWMLTYRRAHTMRKRRNELELSLENLRGKKKDLPEEEYLRKIEPILLDLSRLYKEADEPAKSE